MGRQKGSRTGRCQGCNHLERVRIERLLAAGASIKGAARKFAIDHHALRRHWINHVSAEARAAYIAGAGATKDQLEEVVADESLALIDHYRIVRAGLYKGFGRLWCSIGDWGLQRPGADCWRVPRNWVTIVAVVKADLPRLRGGRAASPMTPCRPAKNPPPDGGAMLLHSPPVGVVVR